MKAVFVGLGYESNWIMFQHNEQFFLITKFIVIYMTDKSQLQQTSNILSLVRLRPQCKIIPTRVDFSTPNRQGLSQTSITPAFNNDGCFYTPSFTLPIDIKYHRENVQFQKSQFEEKIQRSLEQTSYFVNLPSHQDLFIVAPSSKYCQICQEKFEDYFHHILLKPHTIRVTNSDASQKIQLLCQEFQNNQANAAGKGKTKNIKKDQKRDEKKVKSTKFNTLNAKQKLNVQPLKNIQNHSTALVEDTLV